ncbi:hypothetical protein SPI_07713 [Niveomyces insectorum RCEF 264]|uniref:Uncharacterized protein n=1 Tax=Niveomyces insectorum RCEF 264 TaxID=1081102 RepID=A0A167PIX2_9HYPO|nr:hypothetical protein SPI_07713 [Niveomyces insectorum RCEF 264]
MTNFCKRLLSRRRPTKQMNDKSATDANGDDTAEQPPSYTPRAVKVETVFWAGLPEHTAVIRAALGAAAASARSGTVLPRAADTLCMYLKAIDTTPVRKHRRAVARILAKSILTVMHRAASLPDSHGSTTSSTWRTIQLHNHESRSKAMNDTPSRCKGHVTRELCKISVASNAVTYYLLQDERTAVALKFDVSFSQMGYVVATKPRSTDLGFGESYARLIQSLMEECQAPPGDKRAQRRGQD